MATTNTNKYANLAGLKALLAKTEGRYLDLDTASDITGSLGILADTLENVGNEAADAQEWILTQGNKKYLMVDGQANRRLAMSVAYRCGFNAAEIQIPLEWDPFREDCTALFKGNTEIEVLPWVDMSAVTNVDQMLMNCTSLTAIDPNLSFSKTTSGNYLFSGCSALKELPEFYCACPMGSGVFMFQNCESLERVGISPAMIAQKGMFQYCRSLSEFPDIFTNPLMPTDISYIFYRCEKLTVIPASFIGKKVTNWDNAFAYCTSLHTIYGLDFTNATSMTNTFSGCSAVTEALFTNVGAKMTAVDLSGLTAWGAYNAVTLKRTINEGLASFPSGPVHTLKLAAAVKARLTEADIAYATSIGWTIA